MSDTARKIARALDQSGELFAYHFWCLGCEEWHQFTLERSDGRGWKFSGTEGNPTFSPSLLYADKPTGRCHLFVRGGEIQYCGDCDHELAGRTVPMAPLDCPDCGEHVDVYHEPDDETAWWDSQPSCECGWRYGRD
ncbi:MAG: DUF6527 family protein [Persicimonas sp.]